MKRSLATIFISFLAVLPAAATETVDTVWEKNEVDFTFIGLEVAYSCNLLESRFVMLLEYVGARDVDVTVPSCAAFPSPQKQLRVIAEFSTLVPAGDDDVDIVKGAWTEVVLDKNHPRSISDDDCEVLEQFQEYLLSAIDHVVVEGKVECSATRRSIVGQLKIKVLEPVVENDPGENGDES